MKHILFTSLTTWALDELQRTGIRSIGDAWKFLQTVIPLAMKQANSASIPGEQKKTLVLDFVDEMLDGILEQLPLPWYLAWLRFFFEDSRRQLILQMAGEFIEFLLEQQIVKKP